MTKILKNYWVLLYAITAIPLGNYFLIYLVKTATIGSDSITFYFLVTLIANISMLVIPIYIIKYQLKESVEKYGFRFPEKISDAIKITLVTLLFSCLVLYFFSKNPTFQNYYELRHGLSLWFLVEVIISFFYFVAEEFFMRGFILFSLMDKIGNKSVIVSNIFFALMHYGKPGVEILFSFFYGIILSIISIRTKSFFPSALIHFFIALVLNLLILFR